MAFLDRHSPYRFACAVFDSFTHIFPTPHPALVFAPISAAWANQHRRFSGQLCSVGYNPVLDAESGPEVSDQ
ncbi:hypothetical protein AB0L97_37415 [Nocardia sp. NPDC051911]|uniref:hypothetical protein n=1 Tax=Nocardia sp. NPDC051911 TaxID=3154648 RepID=UPI003415FBE8